MRRITDVPLMTVLVVVSVVVGLWAGLNPTTNEVVVNCNNASANDGGNSPERDITPAEWVKFCELG